MFDSGFRKRTRYNKCAPPGTEPLRRKKGFCAVGGLLQKTRPENLREIAARAPDTPALKKVTKVIRQRRVLPGP